MKGIIKKLLGESVGFHIVENLLREKYSAGFNLELFNAMKSFNQRIQYCQQNLKRISSGTARIVYMIDDTKVLKLAKNPKGLGQNRAEIAFRDNVEFQDLLAQVLESHQYALWVEMELARKVTPTIFRNYFGVDPTDLEDFLTYKAYIRAGKKIYVYPSYDIIEKLEGNKFVDDLIKFMAVSKAMPYEFTRLSSYGVVNRGGQDRIVIIDFGLTDSTYEAYYA